MSDLTKFDSFDKLLLVLNENTKTNIEILNTKIDVLIKSRSINLQSKLAEFHTETVNNLVALISNSNHQNAKMLFEQVKNAENFPDPLKSEILEKAKNLLSVIYKNNEALLESAIESLKVKFSNYD